MKKQIMSPPSANKSRRFNDSQTIRHRRRSSRLSTSDDFSSKIPIDLITEIFSRLPLNSIARCRCVSKRWASLLRSSDFTELFLSKSLPRPQLLFCCRKEREVIFFSSPQPLGENSFPIIATTVDHHVSFPVERACHVSGPLSGVVCISDDRILKGRKTRETVWVICNPSTGQSLTLPKMKTRKRTGLRSYLGYDPVEKQHKVLAMIWQKNNGAEMHQILTLGNGRSLTWRRVECGLPHSFPERECVCINGILYYVAKVVNLIDMLVCFDIRAEKYSFVKLMESGMYEATLINFQGKLASVRSSSTFFLSGTGTCLKMCVLDNPDTHEWSKHVFNLPPMGKEAAAGEFLKFVGVTTTNEFVVSPLFPYEPFYVYFYNFVKDSLTRVEIQGIGAFDNVFRVSMFLNHVEDVKLM